METTQPAVPAEPTAPVVAADTPETQASPTDTAVEQPKAESKPQDDALDAKKALRGVQKRIDELTRSRYEAEAKGKQEAEYWRQQALAQAQALEEMRRAQPGPKWEQYQDIEKFTDAVAAHRADQIVRDRLAEADKARFEQMQQAQKDAEHRAQVDRFQAVVAAKVQEAQKKYGDFVDVVTSPDLPPMQGTPAFNAILDSESGADVLYYLGKNAARAHHIVSLPPLAQIREIGRIESLLASGKAVTGAPPPPNTVGGGKAPATKDPSDMSYEEFVKFRRRQIAQRR